ncbi:MAG: NmrA/HSCARG family protein [Thermoactinospora sp.]|nr:NmrA/HSCARG family protein [Thermoactinospora sp.]
MRTIVVAGATGNQGGATVEALLAGGWRVRALTRDVGSGRARALEGKGAEVREADFGRPDTLVRAFEGAYGVFSVQARGKDEVRHGVAVAEAARKAGVEHLVYTSVGGVDRVRGIPHFDTKWEIEQHILAGGLPYTFLRPSTFMETFAGKGAGIGLSMMAAALGERGTLQLVAARDIGVFARIVFDKRLVGQSLELAGDELTVPRISEIAGVPYRKMPRGLLRLMGREGRMFFWFAESGYQADIAALRALHPGLLTFGAWREEQRSAA